MLQRSLIVLSLLLLAAAAAARCCGAAVVAAGSDEAEEQQQQQQDCAWGDQQQAPDPFRPKAVITDEAGDNLANVRDVLLHIGYELTDNPAEASLIWTWRDPFTKPTPQQLAQQGPEPAPLAAAREQLRRLTAQQHVNQLPAVGFLTSKAALASYSASLSFLPRTFKLPQEYEAWQAFIKTDAGSSMRWIQKGVEHRGVSIIPDPAASSLAELRRELLVQQLVAPPFLIHRRAWDVGVYVAVTSLEPLVAYVFASGALLRFCRDEYPAIASGGITLDTPSSAYVIHGLDDYMPAADVPPLAPHFADAGVDSVAGGTAALAALRAHLATRGVNTTAWWLDVQAGVVAALQAAAPAMADHARYHYTGARSNFFGLLRFDFMMTDDGTNHDGSSNTMNARNAEPSSWSLKLLEVNMSPGLVLRPSDDVPRHAQLLPRKLVHDLLVLKGLGPGGHAHPFTHPEARALKYHPGTLALGEPACGDGSCADCGRPVCGLCAACRNSWQSGMLVRLAAEQLAGGGFVRVHPPGRALAAHMAAAGMAENPAVVERPDDALARAWLDAKCTSDARFC